MEIWQWVLLYWVILCMISFTQFFIDKRKAQKGKWRIPEKTLFITAGLGGAAGALLGMKLFRHKTQHKSFTIGILSLLILHIILAGVGVWFMTK